MRKKMMLAALLCAVFVCNPCSASDDDYDLYLLSSEGEYVSLGYSTLRSLSFAQMREDGVTVNKMLVNRVDGTSDEFNLLTYDAIVFESVATGINGLPEESADDAVLELHDGKVYCHAGGDVRVCLLDGRVVKTLTVKNGEAFSIDALASGTYIVNINGKSVKIQKR